MWVIANHGKKKEKIIHVYPVHEKETAEKLYWLVYYYGALGHQQDIANQTRIDAQYYDVQIIYVEIIILIYM